MGELKLIIEKDNDRGAATILEEYGIMFLNINRMIVFAKEQNMSFDKMFMQCLSHETIHQIIYDIESDNASKDFDNICMRKYKWLKFWIGGVGN